MMHSHRPETPRTQAPSKQAETFYLCLKPIPAEGRNSPQLQPLRHGKVLNEYGDPLDGKSPLPNRIRLESGTWEDVMQLAKKMIENAPVEPSTLRPFRYLFMVTRSQTDGVTAKLAAITTTQKNDIRAGETPGAPIIVRKDPYLEIATCLIDGSMREGREVCSVDL